MYIPAMVGEVGLRTYEGLASGFTVRPLCRSGHSPNALKAGAHALMRTGLATVNLKSSPENLAVSMLCVAHPELPCQELSSSCNFLDSQFDARQIETFKGGDGRVWEASQNARFAAAPNRP